MFSVHRLQVLFCSGYTSIQVQHW